MNGAARPRRYQTLAPIMHPMAATSPARRLRIIHYFPGIRLELGGPVRVVLDLCNVLSARGHEPIVVTYDSPDIPPDWNTPGKPQTILIPPALSANWFVGDSARAIFDKVLAGGGVAHLHSPWAASNIQFARSAHAHGVPYVVTMHGMLNDWPMSQRGPKKRFYLSIAGRRYLQRADRIHFTAQAELDQSWKWIERGTPAVIPCMMDLEPYHRLPGAQLAGRAFASAIGDGPVVLFLSRLHEKKGLDLLIDAFGIIRDSGSPARLLIAGVGTPDYEAELRKQVHERRLEDRIFFVGMVRGDTKLSLYQRADLFVLPTRQENFGLVLVESLACATPVVTTRGTDIWREMEQAGSTITELDPASVARGILDSLADPESLHRRGQQGRQWVLDNLDPDRLALEYEHLYEQMIDQRRPSAPVAAPRPIIRHVVADQPLQQTPAPSVSVVVLTHDEAANIRDCLASCAWCDDVHLLDSGSTDGTPDIARKAGATVHFHPFPSFGAQHNWIIDHIPTKYPWQFHIDADERFTPGLVAEMLRRIGPNGADRDAAGFLVPSQMIFQGRWIRHSSEYPNYQVRLIHVGRCRFIASGHGQREQSSGTIGTFVHPYTHYNFSKGMAEWFRRHNRYSDHDAAEALADMSQPLDWAGMFAANPVSRRRALKRLSYRLRGRGIWRFLFTFFCQGGWLDGSPGFQYTVCIALYEYWTELKIIEGRFQRRPRIDLLSRLFTGASVAKRIESEIRRAEYESQQRLDRKRRFRSLVRNEPILGRLRRWREFLRDDLGPELPFRPLFQLIGSIFASSVQYRSRGLHSAIVSAGTEYMTGVLYREKTARRRALPRSQSRHDDQPAPSPSVASLPHGVNVI